MIGSLSFIPENHMPDTPLTTRFKTRIHRLKIADRTIDLLAPTDPDALLDDPAVQKRYHADNYMPYWPIVWPSGLVLASHILRHGPPKLTPTTTPARCIDLGCGLGATGIAAALQNWHVTFTDYDKEAVEFAAHNAARNGIPPHLIRATEMDWREPLNETFDWIVASDVLYERRLHPLVLNAVSKLLAKNGTAWISDPHRTSAEDFPLEAATAGFKITTIPLDPSPESPQPAQCFLLQRP
jgi:predicted nicotinamide N-methyase